MKNDPASADADHKEGVNGITLSPEKVELIRGMLDQADHYLKSVRHLLVEEALRDKAQHLGEMHEHMASDGGRYIEGVFNGEAMIGHDGRTYPVPPNYASKSKLVVGDVLKLTIADDGTFIYKQIGPVERQKLIAELEQEAGRFVAVVENRHYNLLTASVTYYHGKPGDKVTIIVPKDGPADWAAVENLIEKQD